MGLSPITTTPAVIGGTPFGQAGTTTPQTPMSYVGTAFGQATSAPVVNNEYQSAINDYNKTLKEAEKTLTIAKKSGNKNQIEAAQGYVDLLKGDIKEVLKLAGLTGGTTSGIGGTGAFAGNRSDASYIAEGRSGTSNTGQNYINGKLATPEEWSRFLYGDKKFGGGSDSGASAATSAANAESLAKRQSAFDLLREQFAQYGLEGLVDPLKGLIQENVSPSEFAVRLRQTEPYKKRFAANAASMTLKSLRTIGVDAWKTKYNDDLVLLETFILPTRENQYIGHSNRNGACYKADNWIELGMTEGNSIKKIPLIMWKKEKRIHTARTMQEARAISCTYQSGREWMGKHQPFQS